MAKEQIRSFSGMIAGSIETLANGDQEVRDFHGRVLGYYRSKDNTTRDYFGKVLAQGNMAAGLLWDILKKLP